MTHELEHDYFPEYEMRQRDVPCWYEISLGQNAKYLQLKIHQDFIQNSKYELGKDRLIEVLERFNLGEFGTDLSGDIGFEKIFKNIGRDKRNMIIFQVEIPKLGTITDKKCELCSRCNDDLSCMNCFGTRREITTNWKTARNFSASLTILTSYLAQAGTITSADFPQLLTLETKTDHDQHGGSLWGVISLKLHNYINSLDISSLNNVCTSAMVASYQNMFFEAPFLKRYFSTEKLEKGGLALNCDGDRSGIFPDEGWHNTNEGYEFTCHNVDSPMQQIALVAGLAALHDFARKEI